MTADVRPLSVDGLSIDVLSHVIRGELVGLQISSAARSHGSMLILKIGQLSDEIRASDHRKNRKPRGEWELFVKFADWSVISALGSSATNSDDKVVIDEAMHDLEGGVITDFSFSRTGHLRIATDSGSKMTVSGENYCAEPEDDEGLWTLFRLRRWLIYPSKTGGLEFEASREA